MASVLFLLVIGMVLAFGTDLSGSSDHGPETTVAASALVPDGAGNIFDSHAHSSTQICHASSGCTAAALTTPEASLPKVAATSGYAIDAPHVGIARSVRPDIKPPIA